MEAIGAGGWNRILVDSEPLPVAVETKRKTAWEIPNFERDNETLRSYEAAVERYVKADIANAELRVQASYAKKREGVSAEINAAQNVVLERRKVSEKALQAYAQRYPHRVQGIRMAKPSFFEFLFSFGNALRLHNNAFKAAVQQLEAEAIYRRRKRREEELDAWYRRSLHRVSVEAKERTQSEEWQNRFNARTEIAPMWAQVCAMREERAGYAERLAKGSVQPGEMRDREMGERKITPLRPPFDGLLIAEILKFGNLAYFICTTLSGDSFWLPFDKRLEPLYDTVFDTYRVADAYEAKVHRSPDGRRLTALDHFIARIPDQTDARLEWRKRSQIVRKGEVYTNTPIDEPEDRKVLDLLATLAASNSPLIDRDQLVKDDGAAIP